MSNPTDHPDVAFDSDGAPHGINWERIVGEQLVKKEGDRG